MARCGLSEFVSVSIASSPTSSILCINFFNSSSLFIKLYFDFERLSFVFCTCSLFSFSKSISPYVEIAELSSLLNSISLKKLKSFFLSISFNKKSSNLFLTGTSFFKVTSFLLIKALSLFSIIVSRLLFCFIVSAFLRSSSKLPNLFINSAAVFTPIPGTPGTLSLESPAKD